MRVFSKKVLREFWDRYHDAEQPLKSWYSECIKSKWNNPNDIKKQYVKASILKNNRIVFNICGNKYRLIVKINYERQWIFMRFIGSHKEYDTIDAENI